MADAIMEGNAKEEAGYRKTPPRIQMADFIRDLTPASRSTRENHGFEEMT